MDEDGDFAAKWGSSAAIGSQADDFDDSSDDEATPFAANEENRKLDKEIKANERRLLQAEAEVAQQKNRVGVIEEHLKSVQQEIKHTEALLEAKKREKDNENHLVILASRAQNRVNNEIVKLKTEIAALTDRMNNHQNEAFRCKQQIEDLRNGMAWNEQELNQWIDKSKVVDDDADLLEKYTRADEAKIKELTLQIEKLTLACTKAGKDLQAEAAETKTQQIGLDKAAEAFQRLHNEQQELTKMWESVIRQMEERDEDIEREAERFTQAQTSITEKVHDLHIRRAPNDVKAAIIKEKEEFQAEQQKTNSEVDREILLTEKSMLKAGQDVIRANEKLTQFRDELASLRNVLGKVTSDGSQRKSELKQLDDQLEKQHHRVQALESNVEEAGAKLKSAQSKTMTSEERTQQLEHMLKDEELDLEAAVREVATAHDEEFKVNQRLQTLAQQEAVVKQDVSGLKASCINTKSRLQTVEKEIAQQNELIYKQDFQITILERDLLKLEGKRSKVEEELFQKQKLELQAQLKDEKQNSTLLQTQIGSVEDKLRASRKKKDSNSQRQNQLKRKLDELDMTNRNAEKDLKSLISAKEDLIVDENVLKLEVRRVRTALNQRADQVLTLEHRKLELKTAMLDRLKEIEIHKEMWQKQIKDSTADITGVSKELKERFSKIEQLQKRYEIIVTTMEADEDGQPKTQAYFIIKHAQEREELQRTGDGLDKTIRKLEKEVRALERTLSMMNGRNTKLKHSLKQTGGTPREQDKLVRLKGQLQTTLDKFRAKRRELKEDEEELEALCSALAVVNEEERRLSALLLKVEDEKKSLDRDLDDQQTKLSRALQRAQRILTDHRNSQNAQPGEQSLEEYDCALRQLKDTNLKIAKDIDGFVETNPALSVQVDLLFSQSGIKRPPRIPGSRTGSQAGSSIASSRVSNRTTVSQRAQQPQTANDAVKIAAAKRKNAVSATTFEFGLTGTTPASSISGTSRPTSARLPSSRPTTGRSRKGIVLG